MGTYTTNYQLYMPTIGETGWGTLVNGNFTTIDTTMKGLSNRITAVENEVNGALNCTSVTASGKITGNGGIAGTTGTFSGTVTAPYFNGICNGGTLIVSQDKLSVPYIARINSLSTSYNILKYSVNSPSGNYTYTGAFNYNRTSNMRITKVIDTSNVGRYKLYSSASYITGTLKCGTKTYNINSNGVALTSTDLNTIVSNICTLSITLSQSTGTSDHITLMQTNEYYYHFI